ncbi:S26 family signal peptidase [Nonomuraea jiangxiensis]|uniref:Signal peptidase I/inner membrane protease subunit 1 n=1 Tax=Nonomuraea jiangxiensis TaxID=633440 RepID=A0A1G8FAZ2_9ACTN|nr:S26 family signal peptidase [Nonomuraea jiangxiensis]SDH79293.1 signal peptidase I/inner membrane protease subunit 1 [Nonomuraea jiangxiensis]
MQAVIAVLLISSGVAAFVAVLRRRFVVATVTGFSMAPTLHPGDRLLVRRTSLSRLRVGDIVVVVPDARMAGPRPRTGYVIKRLAAVPGDLVPEHVPSPSNAHIPPGWMAILGDNPDASRDSRDYGLVTQKRLVGVVVRAIGT